MTVAAEALAIMTEGNAAREALRAFRILTDVRNRRDMLEARLRDPERHTRDRRSFAERALADRELSIRIEELDRILAVQGVR